MEEVIHWACNVDQKKLKEFLMGTPAEAIFSGSEKAVGSARFVLSKNLAPHLKMPEGNFSCVTGLMMESREPCLSPGRKK
ncbi:hypothetical protein ACFSKS_26525 [Pseudocitrobacter faecalis]